MSIEFLFSILCISLTLTGNFMSLQSSLFGKFLATFVSLAGWWSSGFKQLTKHHLNHSLSSIFWILMNLFLGWFNFLGKFMNSFQLKDYILKNQFYGQWFNQ